MSEHSCRGPVQRHELTKKWKWILEPQQKYRLGTISNINFCGDAGGGVRFYGISRPLKLINLYVITIWCILCQIIFAQNDLFRLWIDVPINSFSVN